MSTLSSANVTDVNLVLKERTHRIKIKYSMHQYSKVVSANSSKNPLSDAVQT